LLEYSHEGLRKIHDTLYEMMIFFHQLCEKHNLNYYMIGGTMLGAVRHKDFIPWDDDIDVALPRNDYDKLISLSDSDMPDNIRLLTMEKMKNFPFAFAKLVNTNTTLIEDIGGKEVVTGVYIDIFPIDGAGKEETTAKKLNKKIEFLRKCVFVSFSNKRYKSFFKSSVAQGIRLIDYKIWLKWLNKTLKKYPYESSRYISNFLGAWGEKEIMHRDFWGRPTLYQFRESQFYGPENYDKYLSSLYNNYMELPPIEKRRSHHNFKYLNLNLPYEEYLKQNGKL